MRKRIELEKSERGEYSSTSYASIVVEVPDGTTDDQLMSLDYDELMELEWNEEECEYSAEDEDIIVDSIDDSLDAPHVVLTEQFQADGESVSEVSS